MPRQRESEVLSLCWYWFLAGEYKRYGDKGLGIRVARRQYSLLGMSGEGRRQMMREGLLRVDCDVSQIQGVHGVAAQTMDIFVGEMQHLVVVEDDDGRFFHDYFVHFAVETDAFGVVGGEFGLAVQFVVVAVAVACVVGPRRATVLAVEEGEVVFGIGIVGNPAATEPGGFALCYLFAQSRWWIDIDFDIHTQ